MQRPLLVSRFSHTSSRQSTGESTHLFGRRWTGGWFRPVSGFGPAATPAPQVPPVPPRFRNLSSNSISTDDHTYHYGRMHVPYNPQAIHSRNLGAELADQQLRALQRSGTRVTLTPADDEQFSTRTLSLSGLSATSLAYHLPAGEGVSRHPSNTPTIPNSDSRSEGSWDERPIWKEILRDNGPIPGPSTH